MTGRGARASLLVMALACGSAFAAYRIVAITQADRWAAEDPQRALQWIPRHPQALLALAERRLAEGRTDEARASARRLLAAAPLEGRAFRVLAAAAVADGDAEQALRLYRIAARRSPRDIATRAWLTGHALVSGDYLAAMAHIDVLLRVAPAQRRVMLPLLAQLAVDPAFASALVRTLAARPPWRNSVLSSLQREQDPRAADLVLSELRRQDGLTDSEFDDWIAALMRRGAWGEAYSRWAGTLDLDGGVLPLVYNGDFERPVSGRGFDWRVTRVPGVTVEFVPDRSAQGLTAHARFRGRPVPQVNLEQPLLLAPGRYTFSVRMRADALRSERGLEWAITCLGQAQPIATSLRIAGSFGWRDITMDLDVPVTDCRGQWLRLRNPVPGGSAQQISGDLWFDNVRIVARG